MSALPKPVLRGHIKRRGLKGIVGAFIFAATNATLFRFLVIKPRERAYEEFLLNYDAEAHYKQLKGWGYFTPNELYD